MIKRKTIKIERVFMKVPILSCGHKYRPIVENRPVKLFYPCALCERAETLKKAREEKTGPIFSE